MALPEFKLHLKGYVGDWDFDSDYVDYVVNLHKGKTLHVLIDSMGGQVNTALSINAAFARHGDVHVHYSGMNASAATFAGASAKEITIDSNALWLVHKSSSFVDIFTQANSSDMSRIIERLQKEIKNHDAVDTAIAECYARRCKKSPKDLADLMAEDRWMTAQEAFEWGFVDSIVESSGNKITAPESVVCAMKEAGMPIPSQIRSQSLIERIAEKVENVLSSWGLKKDNSLITDNMENQETIVEAVEAVEAPAVENQEQASPDTENVTPTVDNSLEIESLRKELSEAKAKIADLEKKPGADTTSVVATAEEKPASQVGSFISDITAARDMMGAVGL